MNKISPQSDHDLLITLNAKVDGLVSDVKAMQDGVGKQITDHEIRIRKIEATHDAVKPEESVKLLNTLAQEFRDFKVSINAFRFIGGLIGGGIFFLLTQIPNILKSFGLLH